MTGELSLSHFKAFYAALNNDFDPFPWQTRLCELVCRQGWPSSLDLPTASGKTSCIEIAVFAMAFRNAGPRRIFFVVDRRVVVDQAFDRMQEIARRLADAREGILGVVAGRLRSLGTESSDPIEAYQMRGGIYRDDSWVRSALQPTLIASTVDQVGSRLLFRGYGVGEYRWPIDAALVANDSLIFLDEAHCSRAFAQTLSRIETFRGGGWAAQSVDAPFAFVEMTATPSRSAETPYRLTDADYTHEVLKKRLYATKPAELTISKARLRDHRKLAEDLVAKAKSFAAESGIRRIAILANRVRTARLAYDLLKSTETAHLLIGRMRPIDRMHLHPDIDAMLSGKKRRASDGVIYVVATQCLEVGADLDFDALVTECASIDALLQRFGRLDRTGALQDSGTTARGCVMIPTPMTDAKHVDPVYGFALSKTWRWLSTFESAVDFGNCSEDGSRTVRERLMALGGQAEELRSESPLAPVLLPSHLDCFAQTSPPPALDPDPHLFLHGLREGSPDVQVVWRSDLEEGAEESWPEIVGLCPPVASEAIPVPLPVFRRWLVTAEDVDGASTDVEGVEADEEIDSRKPRKPDTVAQKVLRWTSENPKIVTKPGEVRPGDTLIVPTNVGGWTQLGHVPQQSSIDVAEQARWLLQRRWCLRLTPSLIHAWPLNQERSSVAELATDDTATLEDLKTALAEYSAKLPDSEWLKGYLSVLATARKVHAPEAYPQVGGKHTGWFLALRHAEADAGGDETSSTRPVPLQEHLENVSRLAEKVSEAALRDRHLCEALKRAAELHDYGKADVRFQALLRGGDPMAARFATQSLAKGVQSRPSPPVRKAQWKRSGLPDGFRHELISFAMIRRMEDLSDKDLVLHLVASHHGRCRPFAPFVSDPGRVQWNGLELSQEESDELAAHRMSSGIPDRFWRLTRRFGWWGLAYLEALLRLSDWEASKLEVKT